MLTCYWQTDHIYFPKICYSSDKGIFDRKRQCIEICSLTHSIRKGYPKCFKSKRQRKGVIVVLSAQFILDVRVFDGGLPHDTII